MQQLTLATAEFERYPKTTLASGDCGRDGGDAVVGGGAGSAPIVAQRPAHCGSERAKDESRQLIRDKVPIGGVSPLRTDRLWSRPAARTRITPSICVRSARYPHLRP